MRALSSLGSKQLAHRKGRSALTAFGIVLGVAILFGVLITNATTQSGVDALVKDFTGSADVIVSPPGAFDAVMPASTVTKLGKLPGVERSVGLLSFRSSVADTSDEQVQISVRGITLSTARTIQPYPLTSGRFFNANANEVVVPARLVSKTGARIGETLKVATPFGVRALTVTGVLADTGAGRTNQGDVMFTSIETARALTRNGNVVTGARLVLDDAVDADTWIEQHQQDLGAGLEFRDAATLAQGFQDFLGVLGAVFTFFAAIVLFVGAFLIYLTLSMAVIERIRMYGTMRALGATRAQIRRLVITEAITLGAVSTVAGLALGLLIAKGLLTLVSGLFELDLPGLTIQPGAVITGIIVGVLTTLIASLIPARRASRLSPVVAMRGDYGADRTLGRAWMVGAFAAFAGIGLGLAGSAALGTPLLLLGAVLLTPLLLRPLARLLGRLTNRLASGVGDVAVLHLVKERSRSAYTLALIMVVMAMIFSIGGLNASMGRALDDTLDRQFGADLHLSAGGTLGPQFEDELRAVPGVGDITALGIASTTLRKPDGTTDDSFVRIIDPETYFAVESFQFSDGTELDARRALAQGGAVLLPQERVATLKLKIGDSVRLLTNEGERDFRIAATYVSFTGPPEVVMSAADARALLNANGAEMYHLNVAERSDVDAVKERLESGVGERYNLTVTTAAREKEDARNQFGQFFNIFYAIILVAGIVGLLGLANTLAMSVLQRTREIGVLRAIGTTRAQIRRMVLVESATMGAVAFALSLPLGYLLSALTVRSVSTAFGFTVPYVYPAGWVPLVAAFGIVVSVLAAIAPGRRAGRLQVVQALQYE